MKRTKHLLLLSLSFAAFHLARGQKVSGRITPATEKKINTAVEQQVDSFRQLTLDNHKYLSTARLAFMLDTFRIKHIADEQIAIDYTTAGMNIAVNQLASSYDKLMNRYYNKLLQLLKPEDRKVLLSAQRSWLTFRNAESKLIGIMMQEEYSGGGSIQSNIASSSYSELVIRRTNQIFNYYDEVVNNL